MLINHDFIPPKLIQIRTHFDSFCFIRFTWRFRMRALRAERNQTLYAAKQLTRFIGVKSMRRPARTIMLLRTACTRVLRASDFHLPFAAFKIYFHLISTIVSASRPERWSKASVNRRRSTAHHYYRPHHHFLVAIAIAIEPMGADRSYGEDESMCHPLSESSAESALILSGRVCINKQTHYSANKIFHLL